MNKAHSRSRNHRRKVSTARPRPRPISLRDSRGRFATRVQADSLPRALPSIWRGLRRGRNFVLFERGRPTVVLAGADQLAGVIERAGRRRGAHRTNAMRPILGQP